MTDIQVYLSYVSMKMLMVRLTTFKSTVSMHLKIDTQCFCMDRGCTVWCRSTVKQYLRYDCFKVYAVFCLSNNFVRLKLKKCLLEIEPKDLHL